MTYLTHRPGLVDIHHAHRGAIGLTAADSAEMGLGRMRNRQAWRFRLLALLPAQKLLAADQGDQQCQNGKQPLLDRHRREVQVGGTLTVHPGAPTTGVGIRLRAFVFECPG
ncbi:hypothetical protein D3C76_1298400 [compost metagenome]